MPVAYPSPCPSHHTTQSSNVTISEPLSFADIIESFTSSCGLSFRLGCSSFVNMNSECLVVTSKLYWIAHLPHWHAGELVDLCICLPPVLQLMNCMLAYSFVIFIATLSKPC